MRSIEAMATEILGPPCGGIHTAVLSTLGSSSWFRRPWQGKEAIWVLGLAQSVEAARDISRSELEKLAVALRERGVTVHVPKLVYSDQRSSLWVVGRALVVDDTST